MMFLMKSPPKFEPYEEPIQPWGSDQSKIMNLILESAETQARIAKHINQQHKSERTPRKQRESYNFYTNLRKYQKKKAEDFFAKKDINFIQRNIKGLSSDFLDFQEETPKSLVCKMIEDKHQRHKLLQSREFKETIEPINLSLVMQYQDNKQIKDKNKAIQNFLKFQSSSIKRAQRKDSIDPTFENAEQASQYQPDQYQRLIKFRQKLRKRSSNALQKSNNVQNSKTIDYSYKSSKSVNNTNYQYFNKTISRNTPKTSQSQRKANTTLVIQHLNQTSSKNCLKIQARKFYTSQINRKNLPQRMKTKMKSS